MAEIDAARHLSHDLMTTGLAYSGGQRTDENGQVSIAVNVVRMTPELIPLASAAGLLQIDPWLRPTTIAGRSITQHSG